MREGRRQRRRPIDCEVVLSWQDRQGPRFVRARGVDLSETGVRVEAEEPLAAGAHVFIRVPEFGLGGTACVRHCARRGGKYAVGLELGAEWEDAESSVTDSQEDYYETLQISPTAEMETIHRVYKMLAKRYHPDNHDTGDPVRFLRLVQAYQRLSDPQKRAEYDRTYLHKPLEQLPVFRLKEFVVGVDAEMNRRLGVLSLLYNRRITNPDRPGLTLLDLENLMAIPREHLAFTVWFLKEKRYLRTESNSESEITSDGVEFVEASVPVKSVLRKLLGTAHDPAPAKPSEANVA